MPEVELVITDTRIWARGATTHWDVPPSIMLGSNGFDLIVGQPLASPTQVVSAVQFIPADAIATLPRTPSLIDALSSVFAAVLENLGVAAPCGRMTLVCPTEWGATRRSVLDKAARGVTADVAFEDIAVRSVVADEGTSHSRRTVVLEFNSLSATASTVVRSHRGVHVESCEHEPALTLAEVAPESRGFDDLCALLDRLLDGRTVDLAQVAGAFDPAALGVIRTAVQRTCGDAVDLRAIGGPDLVRSRRSERSRQSDARPTVARTEWLQPLRNRAAAQRPARHTTGYVAAGVAAVVVVALVVIAAMILLNRGDDAAAAEPATTTRAARISATAPPETTEPAGPETFGRIHFEVPTGWRIASAPESGKARVDLVPEDGARLRLTVTQTPLVAGSGYEQVASKLEAQIAQRPAGTLTDLRRDAVFGGRSGLAYSEHPGDGSNVRWHVLLEYGIQVSIGCQSAGDGWTRLEAVCENFGNSVRAVP